MLKARGISKRWDQSWVLRDIDFRVSAGEVVGIIGGPGSGKTTLMRILAGDLKPNSGTLEFGVHNESATQKRFVSKFDVGKGGGRGLLQRLFCNRSQTRGITPENLVSNLTVSPSLQLLDGGLHNLGREQRTIMFQEVRAAIQSSGSSLVIASSSFEDALDYCDRAYLLDGTYIISEGTPRELYENPTSIAGALITGEVNLLRARRTSSSKSENPILRLIDSPLDIMAKKTPLSGLGPINQNVTLMIRPESLSISFGASFPEDNLLKCRVVDIHFRGSYTALKLDCDGFSLNARVPRVIGLKVGEGCVVGLPPDRIHILTK